MTIEKIFIPTVRRVDNQITYNGLPDELKKRVVFVVQAWERDQYEYDAEYLVLPKDIHVDGFRPIARTREIIYEAGKDMKYAMIDDDMKFLRRNTKYFTGESDMEKSKRYCTDDDYMEMFEEYDTLLDVENNTAINLSFDYLPPQPNRFDYSKFVHGAIFLNGPKFRNDLPKMKLTETATSEDLVLTLYLLTMGYQTVRDNKFLFRAYSMDGGGVSKKNKMESHIWSKQTAQNIIEDHKTMQRMFPEFIKIVSIDPENVKAPVKRQVFYKKAYEWSQQSNIEEFFQ